MKQTIYEKNYLFLSESRPPLYRLHTLVAIDQARTPEREREQPASKRTYIDVSVNRCVMKRRIVVQSPDVDIGTSANELASDVEITQVASFVKRSPAFTNTYLFHIRPSKTKHIMSIEGPPLHACAGKAAVAYPLARDHLTRDSLHVPDPKRIGICRS